LPIGLRRHCPPAARWAWIVVGERCMLPAVGARFVPGGVAAIEIFVPVELYTVSMVSFEGINCYVVNHGGYIYIKR
jgi:hypothetical protein